MGKGRRRGPRLFVENKLVSAWVSDDCGLLWQMAVYPQSPESNMTNRTTDARTSTENNRKSIENRPKIVAKSFSDDQSGHNHPGRLLVRCFGRQKRAQGAPRAFLGRPGPAKRAWETLPGAPKMFKKAPGELPRRTWSPFVLASAAQDARRLIFEGFCDEISKFFKIVRT